MEFGVRTVKVALLSFCCLFLMISNVAFGQSFDPPITSDPNIDVIEMDENKALREQLNMNDLNRITLQQMGRENRATVLQLSGADEPNLVHIYQDGIGNRSVLVQAGQRNATDISQVGVGNAFLGIHTGEDIINTVIQTGEDNMVRQFLMGNDMDFHIYQDGEGHELNQIQVGNGIGYKVTQTGEEGMNITIIQDYVLRR
jgi:hypothetical protein